MLTTRTLSSASTKLLRHLIPLRLYKVLKILDKELRQAAKVASTALEQTRIFIETKAKEGASLTE